MFKGPSAMNDALRLLPHTPEAEAELTALEQGRGSLFRDMLRLVLHWAKQRGIYGALLVHVRP